MHFGLYNFLQLRLQRDRRGDAGGSGELGRSRLGWTRGSWERGFRRVVQAELRVVGVLLSAGPTEGEEVAVTHFNDEVGLVPIFPMELPVDVSAVA